MLVPEQSRPLRCRRKFLHVPGPPRVALWRAVPLVHGNIIRGARVAAPRLTGHHRAKVRPSKKKTWVGHRNRGRRGEQKSQTCSRQIRRTKSPGWPKTGSNSRSPENPEQRDWCN